MQKLKKDITMFIVLGLVAGAVTASPFILDYFVNEPTIYIADKPTLQPCPIECLVHERANKIYIRDEQEYRRQAYLKAMLEINGEMQQLTASHIN